MSGEDIKAIRSRQDRWRYRDGWWSQLVSRKGGVTSMESIQSIVEDRAALLRLIDDLLEERRTLTASRRERWG